MELRYGSWLDLYSCGIGGVSGSGKSTTVRSLLFQGILAKAKLLMIDPHIGDPQESLAAQFKMFPGVHVFPPCGDSPTDVLKRIRWLHKEYLHRKHTGIKAPAIILVVDEVNALFRVEEVSQELAKLLLEIAQEGRKFGLFAMLIGQRWSDRDLGGRNTGAAVRGSLASKICHRFTDENQAKLFIGSKYGKASLELPQGHFFFQDTQGGFHRMVTPATYAEDGTRIARLLQRNHAENTPENTKMEPLQPRPLRVISRSEPVFSERENTNIEQKARAVIRLQANNVQKPEIMRQVWQVNPGGSEEYKKAVEEYLLVMHFIADRLEA